MAAAGTRNLGLGARDLGLEAGKSGGTVHRMVDLLSEGGLDCFRVREIGKRLTPGILEI